MTSSRRAQVVLAAAVVVATALVPMLVAYLQLGYPADAAVDRTDRDAVGDARRYLDRAAYDAAHAAAGTDWRNRAAAVDTLNATFTANVARLERRGASTDTVYTVGYNHTAAARLADRSCPRGDHRQFGRCTAEHGFVVQRRANTTTTLAVAVDLSVRSPRTRTTATLVVRPYR